MIMLVVLASDMTRIEHLTSIELENYIPTLHPL